MSSGSIDRSHSLIANVVPSAVRLCLFGCCGVCCHRNDASSGVRSLMRGVIVSKCLFMMETPTESQQLMDGSLHCCHDCPLMRPKHTEMSVVHGSVFIWVCNWIK